MQFPTTFPKIKLSKYRLREAQKSDAQLFFEYLSDPQTIEYTSYDLKSVREVEKWFADYKKQFKEAKRISWVIEDTEIQKIIGEISFFDVQVEHAKGEIGYFLAREYWGRGIMSEVLAVVLKYLFQDLKINRLQSIVMKENIGSIRLLEKNSFQGEGVLKEYKCCRGRYCDFMIYARLATSKTLERASN